ncbi:MAG: glycoside hydrolase family 97 N-terminal domain-containing protein, partial [Chitinophagaceae bacterium]|nr:glycoside hydrolase family 97 N-terminal domain-containing protein [Chitinophagaceae bacterium]
MKRICTALFFIICSHFLLAQNKVSVSSPDKELNFKLGLEHGHPAYSVTYKNKNLAEHSTLGLTFEGNEFFGGDVEILQVKLTNGIADYLLPAGKNSKVHDAYNEALIPMEERKGKKRLVNLRVRIFNDGIGFRYELPQQNDWHNYILTDENTQFNLTGNPTARVAFLQNFTTSHEHRYNVMPLKQIRNDTLMDMPALFEFPGKVFMAITEANLVNYAGMSLIKRDGILYSQLTPLPGQASIKVKASLPHHTPWRVMMI